MRGEWQRAIDALERSLAIARERHTASTDGWRLALLGESYLGLGDMERARGLVAEGLEIAHARGNLFEETHANLALARVLLGSADPAARRGDRDGTRARARARRRARGRRRSSRSSTSSSPSSAPERRPGGARARAPKGAPPVHGDRRYRPCRAPGRRAAAAVQLAPSPLPWGRRSGVAHAARATHASAPGRESKQLPENSLASARDERRKCHAVGRSPTSAWAEATPLAAGMSLSRASALRELRHPHRLARRPDSYRSGCRLARPVRRGRGLLLARPRTAALSHAWRSGSGQVRIVASVWP